MNNDYAVRVPSSLNSRRRGFRPAVRLAVLALAPLAASPSLAGADHGAAAPVNLMDQVIVSRPELAARDRAMGILYRAALIESASTARQGQRAWVYSTRRCRDVRCITDAYDERIAWLMQHHAGRHVVKRFHMEKGSSNGDLSLFLNAGWVTYDIQKTDVGLKGVDAGDVNAAHMTGTARFVGLATHEVATSGCQITLREENLRTWTVMQGQHCDFGGATLSGRYAQVGRGR